MNTTPPPLSPELVEIFAGMERRGKAPVPWVAFGRHLKIIVGVIGELARQLRGAIRDLEARAVLSDARTANLERGIPGVKFCGPHEPGGVYRAGELVRVKDSGLWIAAATTTASPGSDPTAWRYVLPERAAP